MFTKSARFYDALYSFKDYEAEAEILCALIRQYLPGDGCALLDVACGTGAHIAHLRGHYTVEGLDLDDTMLDIARQRFPDVMFHDADMVDFDLGRRFDVVTCLFSSIGYVKTVDRLNQTLATFARHMEPGGLVIVEPWLAPEIYQPGKLHALFVDEPDLKITRMNISQRDGSISWFDFHYLVATVDGVEHFVEHHELTLFTDNEYRAAFAAAGLDVNLDAEGLSGRGVYIGIQKG